MMVESLRYYTFSPLTPNEKYCNICEYCNSIPSKHIETFWVICEYCNFSFITHSEGFWIKCEFCTVKFITYCEGFWARCGYYIFSFITHNEGFWIMCGYCQKNCVFHLSTIYYSKYNKVDPICRYFTKWKNILNPMMVAIPTFFGTYFNEKT